MNTATATQSQSPLVFQVCEEWCFGWHHQACAPPRGVGVVLCRPMGYEAMCSYRLYTRLADALAHAGFDVIRFDYHGTGDSAGCDADTGRVEAWVDSVKAASLELKRISGVSRLAFFGVRLGATLAAQAASQLGGVESLVMWAPCVGGRDFSRELRAASSTRTKMQEVNEAAIEALGQTYTAQTLQELNSLECRSMAPAPAQRALIIGRDDMPLNASLEKLTSAYRGMGMDVTNKVLPGYSGMMAEPLHGVLDHNTLAVIVDWLCETPAKTGAVNSDTPCPKPQVESVLEGISEIPVVFGPAGTLFGILTEPANLSAAGTKAETAILMLNVGGNYRIGPNRIYVKMARSLANIGYRALRFDLTGIGDSRSDTDLPYTSIYLKDSTADVRAAIDWLMSKGIKHIIVMGICSGAYVAFQTAIVDPRVTGQVLMNPRLLEWKDEKDGNHWQGAMQTYYKSTHFYRRALLQPEVYRRIWRGEVDVTGIARRFKAVIEARLKRTFSGMTRPGALKEDVLAKAKRLSARGTDTLMIIAEEDDGRDYVEFHFGVKGSRMSNHSNFTMLLVQDSDHTFSNAASQRHVIASVKAHLEQKLSSVA